MSVVTVDDKRQPIATPATVATALSRQEISFLRRYSLKRPYPLKKETLALNSTISPVPGETKYDGFGPFSRFFRPRAPPRPRATPATGPPPPPGPGTVARRPGRARAARGGSPRGEKGPFFQLLGLGLATSVREAPAARAGMLLATGHCENGARRSTPRVTRTIKPATKAVPTSATSFMNALGPKHTHLRRAPWRRRAAA